MRPFEASFGTIVTRYYLMMALIIVGFWSGIYVIAYLGLPVFLTCILGVSFKSNEPKHETVNTAHHKIEARENYNTAA